MKVFIGCSAEHISEKYINFTEKVADFFYKRHYDLVYGAASFSMMGKCYDVFKQDKLNLKPHIYAYTVEKYEDDIKNLTSAECYLEQNCFLRTQKMFDASDVICILPGGVGSLAELTISLEELRTYENQKKLILFNIDGYYDDIINWYNLGIKNGFIKESIRKYLNIVTNMDELLNVVIDFEKNRR